MLIGGIIVKICRKNRQILFTVVVALMCSARHESLMTHIEFEYFLVDFAFKLWLLIDMVITFLAVAV